MTAQKPTQNGVFMQIEENREERDDAVREFQQSRSDLWEEMGKAFYELGSHISNVPGRRSDPYGGQTPSHQKASGNTEPASGSQSGRDPA